VIRHHYPITVSPLKANEPDFVIVGADGTLSVRMTLAEVAQATADLDPAPENAFIGVIVAVNPYADSRIGADLDVRQQGHAGLLG
jgi:hypothetical protein